jgi:3-methylcrotonyl-CoA carboxylase alpha subunit
VGEQRPRPGEYGVVTERAITKVLVANRGEIAVRIMQTCAEMGIGTAAVFSTADAAALHVQRADEAYCIGPPPALESYLNMDALLEVARESGADAVHPGYGFLAESDAFARRVQESDLIWVGPPPDVIARMGDKVAAKELATAAGVPVVPGYMAEDMSLERMLSEADRVGYPVMLKAAAGGGGKGMRTVDRAESLAAALEGARREAKSAFGDDRVFLEKLLLNPRHIEIQVLFDAHGNGLYLGERECSLQRRHQKVIEESPSPVLTPDLRTRMGEAALRLAHAAGYESAGTVEFLFAGDDFYFLEMNTRVQVEHPVTEMVLGLDVIRMQLEIAAGAPLRLSQLDVRPRGHAIEARVYAEDPASGFLPATGRIELFRPPLGPGTRNDVGVSEGSDVSPYYDPILAKLVVHATNRPEAVQRLQQALERYAVLGVTTNLSFLHWLAQREEFIAGRTDTGLVDRIWKPAAPAELSAEVLMLACAFEQMAKGPAEMRAHGRGNPWQQPGGWRAGGVAQLYRYSTGESTYTIRVSREREGRLAMHVGDEMHTVTVESGGPGVVVLHEGARVMAGAVARRADGLDLSLRGSVYHLRRPELQASARATRGHARSSLTSPMPGTVVKVAVQTGQRVSAHEPLLVLEAMKMEHVIEAPHDGVVTKILFEQGDLVPAGSPVVELDQA